MSKLKLGIGFIIAALVGTGIGYVLVPKKVVEKVRYLEAKTTQKNTVTTIHKFPNGTIVTVIDNKDKINESKSGESIKLIDKKNLNWLVSASALQGIDAKAEYAGSVQYRLFGELYAGVIASTTKRVGLIVSMRF